MEWRLYFRVAVCRLRDGNRYDVTPLSLRQWVPVIYCFTTALLLYRRVSGNAQAVQSELCLLQLNKPLVFVLESGIFFYIHSVAQQRTSDLGRLSVEVSR